MNVEAIASNMSAIMALMVVGAMFALIIFAMTLCVYLKNVEYMRMISDNPVDYDGRRRRGLTLIVEEDDGEGISEHSSGV